MQAQAAETPGYAGEFRRNELRGFGYGIKFCGLGFLSLQLVRQHAETIDCRRLGSQYYRPKAHRNAPGTFGR
jgi:hypothetical protein